jgi:hypothetical protein
MARSVTYYMNGLKDQDPVCRSLCKTFYLLVFKGWGIFEKTRMLNYVSFKNYFNFAPSQNMDFSYEYPIWN